MKLCIKYLILFNFLFLLKNGVTQTNEFAPIGAKWWYDYQTLTSEGVLCIESIGDTLINDKACRILNRVLISIDFAFPDLEIDTTILNAEYIYEDSGIVYWFIYNSFYELYNFKSTIGDSWEVTSEFVTGLCDTTGFVNVTDTSSIIINGINLKEIVIDTIPGNYLGFFNKQVIEKIGSLGYLFPTPLTAACGIDLHNFGSLRCYFDNDLGAYSTGISSECALLNTFEIASNKQNINIFPNPFINEIAIIVKYFPTEIFLYDMFGRLILYDNMKSFEQIYNTQNLKSGLYILKSNFNNYSTTQKLIKL